MGVRVLTDAHLTIEGVDGSGDPDGTVDVLFSGRVRQVEVPLSRDLVDATTMGEDGDPGDGIRFRRRLPGLRDGALNVTFLSDEDAGKVNDVLWTMYMSNDPFMFDVRGSGAAVGAGNERYSGHILIESYTPWGGGAGDLAETPVSFMTDGKVERLSAAR